jgi:hypothetical protein
MLITSMLPEVFLDQVETLGMVGAVPDLLDLRELVEVLKEILDILDIPVTPEEQGTLVILDTLGLLGTLV